MTIQTNESGALRVHGIELGYRIDGEGESLILLPGGFGSVEMFGPNVELLPAVIGVDLQSHGRSPAAERPMRFETMPEDIAALIQSLGFERAAIMGFSVGLRTAIQHPDVTRAARPGVDRVQATGVVPGDDRRYGRDGAEAADSLKQTPMYEAYQRAAPTAGGMAHPRPPARGGRQGRLRVSLRT